MMQSKSNSILATTVLSLENVVSMQPESVIEYLRFEDVPEEQIPKVLYEVGRRMAIHGQNIIDTAKGLYPNAV